jgi:alanyl-tRNA synthetase
MVSMGDFSKELCGGTHLENTGQVGLFKITGEESVSAGTRRITALVGAGAIGHVRQHERALREAAGALKVRPVELAGRVTALAKEVRELKKQLASGPGTGVSADQLLAAAEDVGGTRLLAAEVPGGTADSLRQLIDQLRKKADPIAVLLVSRVEDRALLVAGISRALQSQGINASDWVKAAAQQVGGGGGGRPDLAQAGGKDPAKLPAALEEGKRFPR